LTEQEHVLVLGGTGHYGREIVRSLLLTGKPVRVLTRDAAAARTTLGEEVELIEGDITRQDSVPSLLEGARSVVIAVAAHDRRQIRNRMQIERDAVLSILERAEHQHVKRVVYLSGYDVRREFAEPLGLLDFARPQLDVQDALARSNLNWTVLGCPPSMEIFFAMIRGRHMNVPGGGPPALPTISPVDAGIITAQAAVRGDLGGRHIRMPGPEALSFPEAARRIADVWGEIIRFRSIPLAPIYVAAAVSRPVFPFAAFIASAAKLLNAFPEALAADVPADHATLRALFNFEPTTLEDEARRRRSCPFCKPRPR
jgi:uncharacterized protein YbjT (DUF2867 family)